MPIRQWLGDQGYSPRPWTPYVGSHAAVKGQERPTKTSQGCSANSCWMAVSQGKKTCAISRDTFIRFRDTARVVPTSATVAVCSCIHLSVRRTSLGYCLSFPLEKEAPRGTVCLGLCCPAIPSVLSLIIQGMRHCCLCEQSFQNI